MATIPVRIDLPAEALAPGFGDGSGTLGLLDGRHGLVEVDADKLRRSLGEFATTIHGVLEDIKQVGEIPLKEVQLSVEVSAEGGVALIGSAKAGVKGALTLTFSL